MNAQSFKAECWLAEHERSNDPDAVADAAAVALGEALVEAGQVGDIDWSSIEFIRYSDGLLRVIVKTVDPEPKP